MKLTDAFKAAASGIRHARLRSFLTMLGIVIGIASVILLMAIGGSAQNLILSQVEGLGSNLIIIIPGGTNSGRFSSPATAQGIVIKSLKQNDVDALRREPAIAAVVAEIRGQADVVYGDNDVTITYEGVTSNFFSVRNFETAKGYPFAENDVNSFNHVTVIGSALANTLFGPTINPLGKLIHIKNLSFRVMGVLPKKGTGAFGIDQDNLVIVPISVGQKQMLGIDYYTDIIVQANNAFSIDFTKSRVTSVLRGNHGIANANKDDFTIQTQEDILSLLGNITSIMTLFLAAIASISLVVGGIGIMNIMLVSVVERTKEIGLRKAVGATHKDILKQFLIEAVMLTAIGGATGILVGSLLTALTYVVLSHVLATGWTFVLPPQAIILAVAVSTITGLAFGIYPARQAAKKNPIDALRYE